MPEITSKFSVRGVTVKIKSDLVELTVYFPKSKSDEKDELMPVIVNKTLKYMYDEGFLTKNEDYDETISVKVTVVITDKIPKHE